jgi:hypothetical protein
MIWCLKSKFLTNTLNIIDNLVFTVPAILSEAMPATSYKVQSEIDTTLEMTYKFTGESPYTQISTFPNVKYIGRVFFPLRDLV